MTRYYNPNLDIKTNFLKYVLDLVLLRKLWIQVTPCKDFVHFIIILFFLYILLFLGFIELWTEFRVI